MMRLFQATAGDKKNNTILNTESQELSPKVTYSYSSDSFPSAISDTDSGRPEVQCVPRITRNKRKTETVKNVKSDEERLT